MEKEMPLGKCKNAEAPLGLGPRTGHVGPHGETQLCTEWTLLTNDPPHEQGG
jgi:hypothetical protein